MPKHLYYPIEEDELIKDKGLQSFEIIMSDRTVKVNRCFIMQDPLDEDLQVKKDWSTIIDYGKREDLKLHFKQDDIDKIYSSIWEDDFIAEFESKQELLEAERQAEIDAEKKDEEEHEKSLELQKAIEEKAKKEPKIYDKNSLSDEFAEVVDNTGYQEFNDQEEEDGEEE